MDGGSTAQYVYDVFNRRIHVQTPSATTEYTYDYAGRRISSWLSPNNTGVEGRIYWDGQQFGYRSSDGTTYFDHQDTLGTERMRTDFGAGAGSSYASLPWGDGYSATIGLAGADQDNEHFAGMEQDENTSNVPMSEHAQFRQYSFLQGRWLAPDPDMGSYDPTNPQSLNRYAYVLNNPLSFIDPTGLFSLPCSQDNSCDDGSDGIDWDNPTRTTPMPVRAPGIGPQRGPKHLPVIDNPAMTACLNRLYQSEAGKAVNFFSAGAMIWGPEPLGHFVDNVIEIGSKFLAVKAGQAAGAAAITSLAGPSAIASPLDTLAQGVADLTESVAGALALPVFAGATAIDVAAHVACGYAGNSGASQGLGQMTSDPSNFIP